MKHKLICLATMLVALPVLVAGCASKDIAAGVADQGEVIELKPGQTLVLTLDSNPTTGYSWQVTKIDETVLKQAGEPEYKRRAGSEGRVGAGGAETFRFDAVASGETVLKLAYARPWEKDVPPVETFEVMVIVR